MLLKLGELEKLAAAPATPQQKISYERAAPRERRETAAEAFEKIGEERTFEVDIVPPKLFKRDGA